MRIDRILVLIFLASALVGGLISYDQSTALGKLGVLTVSTLIYFIVGAQPDHRKDILITSTISVGVLVCIYFLFSHDWYRWPVDYEIISRIGSRWMELRPQLGLEPVHPNFIGGSIAILLPLTAVEVVHNWRLEKHRRLFIDLAAFAILGVSLILTSSRAAWFALLMSLIFVSGYWAFRVMKSSTILAVTINLLILATILNVIAIDVSPIKWLMSVPGAVSRFELLKNSLFLANDFLYLGGGLGSFPGLYSRYMLVIPVVFLDYSHNLYLDLIIEQGILGLTAFLGVMAVAISWSIRRIQRSNTLDHNTLLSLAILCGLLVILLHGLLDDPLYGGLGNPLLLLLPAWAAFLHESRRSEGAAQSSTTDRSLRWRIVVASALLPTTLFVVIRSQKLAAGVLSNIASVQMASIELEGWPESSVEGRKDKYTERLRDTLQRVIHLDQDRVAAHYRLGLIAIEKMDFSQSIIHLEKAYELNQNHRGVVKNLGFVYVWQGNLEGAVPLLAQIPEANKELSTYTWWWGTQGEDLLAERSALAASALR